MAAPGTIETKIKCELNMTNQKLMFIVKIAGQYVLLNELQYEKYLIYGTIRL